MSVEDYRPAAAAVVPAVHAGPVPGANRQALPAASAVHASPEQGRASAACALARTTCQEQYLVGDRSGACCCPAQRPPRPGLLKFPQPLRLTIPCASDFLSNLLACQASARGNLLITRMYQKPGCKLMYVMLLPGNPRLAIPREAASAPAAFAVLAGRPLWVPHNPAPCAPQSLSQALPQTLQTSSLVPAAAPAPLPGAVASAASAPPQSLNPVLPGLNPEDLVSILRNAGVQPSAAANLAPYPAGVACGPSSAGLAGQAPAGSKPAPAAWAKGAGPQGTRAHPDLLPPELRELLGQLGQK